MGYIRHHAIIVTCYDEAGAETARSKARELGMHPTNAVATVNAYCTFLVPPDGSKEGWEASDNGDEARAAFKEWLRNASGVWPTWCEVQYGDEEGDNRMVDHA